MSASTILWGGRILNLLECACYQLCSLPSYITVDHTVDAQQKTPMVYRARWKNVADALTPRYFHHSCSNKESIPPDLKVCRPGNCTKLSVFQTWGLKAQNDLLPCVSELGELAFYSLYPLQELGL